jgi:hypothetical protein
MARALASAASQYLIHNAAVAAAEPLTMACWFSAATLGVVGIPMSICTNGGNARHQLQQDSTNRLDLYSVESGGTFANSSGTNGEIAAAGTWYHAAGVLAAGNSRTGYFNGVAHSANATSLTVSGLDRTLIGARISGGAVGSYFNGSIAEAAVWSVALDAAEIAALAKGFSPTLVMPSALVAYWPLIGRIAPEICPKGGFDLTLVNGPTSADQPRVILPQRVKG